MAADFQNDALKEEHQKRCGKRQYKEENRDILGGFCQNGFTRSALVLAEEGVSSAAGDRTGQTALAALLHQNDHDGRDRQKDQHHTENDFKSAHISTSVRQDSFSMPWYFITPRIKMQAFFHFLLDFTRRWLPADFPACGMCSFAKRHQDCGIKSFPYVPCINVLSAHMLTRQKLRFISAFASNFCTACVFCAGGFPF